MHTTLDQDLAPHSHSRLGLDTPQAPHIPTAAPAEIPPTTLDQYPHLYHHCRLRFDIHYARRKLQSLQPDIIAILRQAGGLSVRTKKHIYHLAMDGDMLHFEIAPGPCPDSIPYLEAPESVQVYTTVGGNLFQHQTDFFQVTNDTKRAMVNEFRAFLEATGQSELQVEQGKVKVTVSIEDNCLVFRAF